ncbi:MAG: hypothetical protein ILA30_00255, partial [Selenomonas sp.]|nr:hypothetical protein [Selenomonas sp.]
VLFFMMGKNLFLNASGQTLRCEQFSRPAVKKLWRQLVKEAEWLAVLCMGKNNFLTFKVKRCAYGKSFGTPPKLLWQWQDCLL